MEKKRLYLGVDVGTSSLKIILNEDGKTIRTITKKYELSILKDGWAEIDPNIWVEAFVTGVQKILDGSDHHQVKRIGITGQMHTLVMLDECGNTVRPAIMWNDLRTKESISHIKKVLQECDNGE